MVSDRTLEGVFGLRATTTKRWGDAIRAATATLAALVAAGMIVVYSNTVQNTLLLRGMQDFGLFDHSARQLRAGGDLYAPPTPRVPDGGPRPFNLNPPHFHLLLLPFTALPAESAFVVWMAISLMALAVSITLMVRTLDLGVWGTATIVTAAIVSPAMHATMMTGQVGLVLLVPFTLAWRAARRGRDLPTGIWLGVCASVKPFFLLFAIDCLLRRRWRAVLAMAASLASIVTIGLIVLGPGPYAQWMRQLAGVTWAEHYMNASLLGVIERTFSATPWGLHPVVDLPAMIRPMWMGAAGLIAVAAVARLRTQLNPDRAFLLAAAAMLLISPLGWIYYLWFLMPPLVAVLLEHDVWPRRQRLLMGLGIAALFTPPPVPWSSFGSGLSTATLGSIYAWGLLLLFLATVSRPRPSRG